MWPLTEETLRRVVTVDNWVRELARLRAVVCVTAKENYALEQVEKLGLTGQAKYERAGIALVGGAPPWEQDIGG